MKKELVEYMIEAWVPMDWQKTDMKSFLTADKDEANAWIDKLPNNYEYKIWQRVWKNKL